MKRLIAFSIVFTLLAAGVFAEFKVTGGAAMSFIPVGAIMFPETATSDATTELAAGFGRGGTNGAATEMQLNFEGSTENGRAGFLFQYRPKLIGVTIFANEIGDNAGLWVKPLDWIRIDAGRFVNNDIRGRMGAGAWFGDYTVPRPGEGDIFSNFDGRAAAMLSLKPTQVAGLGVYVLVNNMAANNFPSYSEYQPWGASKGIAYIYENTQFAVSYAIPNIGLARLQYVGAHPLVADYTHIDRTLDPNTGLNNDPLYPVVGMDLRAYLPSALVNIRGPQVQFAFAYTGVPNLTVDVGVKYPLPVSDPESVETGLGLDDGTEVPGKFQAPISAALGVKYVAGSLTATLIVDGKFAGSYEPDGWNDPAKLGIELRPWLTLNYIINDTFNAQVEGGIVYVGESKQGDDVFASGAVRYGFGAGIQTNFAPDCRLRAGITYAGGERPGLNTTGLADPEAVKLNGVFSVPLIFSVSF